MEIITGQTIITDTELHGMGDAARCAHSAGKTNATNSGYGTQNGALKGH